MAPDDSRRGPGVPPENAEERNSENKDALSADAEFGQYMSSPWWKGDGDSSGKPPSDDAARFPAADGGSLPAKTEEDDGAGGKSMGLMDHLSELRSRLVRSTIWIAIGFGVCWAFVDPIFNALVNPLLSVLPEGTHAQYTTLPEAFFTRMYVAFIAGLFLASPAIFYQIWAFVAPGLYDEEKRYIIPIAFLSACFFITGAAFCYYIVFPYAFNFFISYSSPDIVITPKISDYLNFVLKLLIAFGLIFEMPVFTLFLARLGIVTAGMMRKVWRYAVVIIFIVAAILTPPDVVSQLLMACPMLLLYELSVGIAWLFGRREKKNSEEDDEEKEGNA